nr:triple gene block 2 [Cherry necrotic rusty mottle virus]
MSLRPPADYSKPILFAVVGVSLAVICATFKANYLPTVGDNIHSLPHGGSYQDGTKAIYYNGLNCVQKPDVGQSSLFGKFAVFLIVISLIALIHVSCKSVRRDPSFHHYCIHHH